MCESSVTSRCGLYAPCQSKVQTGFGDKWVESVSEIKQLVWITSYYKSTKVPSLGEGDPLRRKFSSKTSGTSVLSPLGYSRPR